MPSDPPLVLLTRHGETEWNRGARMQGQIDTPLSAVGEGQAASLAARLAREGVVRIVSSDLLRARATAEAVGRACGLPVTLDARLREQHLGAWSGLTWAEAGARDPDLTRRFLARDLDARPPSGETRVELQARAWQAFEAHAAPGTAGPLLIVAHGGVVQALVYRVLGISLATQRRFLLPNVGLTTLAFVKGHWFVHTLSDTTHLAGRPEDRFPFE